MSRGAIMRVITGGFGRLVTSLLVTMRRPETQRQGSPRGLDTHRRGGQVSTPSIRFRRSYPQTRDGAALHTPLATLLSTPHS